MWMRTEDNKTAPSWKWFSQWLKSTPELHTIKTKPIASHRVDLHTEQSLREWFETQYRPALEETGIRHGDRIHNMDEKGARICMPSLFEAVCGSWYKLDKVIVDYVPTLLFLLLIIMLNVVWVGLTHFHSTLVLPIGIGCRGFLNVVAITSNTNEDLCVDVIFPSATLLFSSSDISSASTLVWSTPFSGGYNPLLTPLPFQSIWPRVKQTETSKKLGGKTWCEKTKVSKLFIPTACSD
jgi:hypothetical protein